MYCNIHKAKKTFRILLWLVSKTGMGTRFGTVVSPRGLEKYPSIFGAENRSHGLVHSTTKLHPTLSPS